MKYPVYERFLSFQGEGEFSGTKAFFIRLHGCPVECSWCDAAGTWHPDHVPSNIEQLTAEQLANEAQEANAPICIITGGEPTIHNLEPLCQAIKSKRIEVHLETAGIKPFPDLFDYIILSPKRGQKLSPEAVVIATDLKVIIDSPRAFELAINDLKVAYNEHVECQSDPSGYSPFESWITWRSIYIHIEWSQRNNQKLLDYMVELVKTSLYHVRIGYQLHKLFAADFKDPRTNTDKIPLGGKGNRESN